MGVIARILHDVQLSWHNCIDIVQTGHAVLSYFLSRNTSFLLYALLLKGQAASSLRLTDLPKQRWMTAVRLRYTSHGFTKHQIPRLRSQTLITSAWEPSLQSVIFVAIPPTQMPYTMMASDEPYYRSLGSVWPRWGQSCDRSFLFVCHMTGQKKNGNANADNKLSPTSHMKRIFQRLLDQFLS